MRKTFLAGILALALALAAAAQTKMSPNTLKLDDKTAAPRASIAEIAWLAGHWAGTGLGGATEEIWSPPQGDNMMGVFRAVREGKVYFYEICTIVEENNSPVLKLARVSARQPGTERGLLRRRHLPEEAGRLARGLRTCQEADGRDCGGGASDTPFDRAIGYKNRSER